MLSTEFDRPPNLVRDAGIYSTRAGSILTSAGPAWDFGVHVLCTYRRECHPRGNRCLRLVSIGLFIIFRSRRGKWWLDTLPLPRSDTAVVWSPS